MFLSDRAGGFYSPPGINWRASRAEAPETKVKKVKHRALKAAGTRRRLDPLRNREAGTANICIQILLIGWKRLSYPPRESDIERPDAVSRLYNANCIKLTLNSRTSLHKAPST